MGLFLNALTDIKGSTQTVRALSRQDYKDHVLDPHLQTLRELVTRHDGRISGTPAGDSILGVFWDANDALHCAVAIQEALPALTFTTNGQTQTQKVRLGIHTSRKQVTPNSEGLYLQDEDTIYAARIKGIAHAAQIIVSTNARTNCDEKQWEGKWKEWGNRRIKDWHETPQVLHELLYDGVERDEPGAQFLPDWFREQNQYISRPRLEEDLLNYFQQKTPSGFATRLVTLHGFGGMGKTRLAMQCCIQAAGMFEGRLFYADLGLDTFTGSVARDETARLNLLTVRIAAAFKLTSSPAQPITPENLHEYLPPARRLLLLLDNYETVAGVPSTQLIQRLLKSNPDLYLLATGRKRVGLTIAEFPREIVGLEPTIARALFVARVRQHRGRTDWVPSAVEETAIDRLLTLTEGIPLALELVAAHTMNNRPLSEIARSLRDAALGSVTRTRPDTVMGDGNERHQSLENCLHWSWFLLTNEEARKALVCLSLFANDCPQSEIADCFPAMAGDPLEAILDAALARHHYDPETDSSTYSLLRPTRTYARERLAEIDPDSLLRLYFVAHYRRIVTENGGFENQENATKRTRLQGAWRHAISAGDIAATLEDADSCAAIAAWLMHFVVRQALWNDASPLYQQAVGICRRVLSPDHPYLAISLNNLAELYRVQGLYPKAEPLYREAVGIALKSLGPSHPNTVAIFGNFFSMLIEQERTADITAFLDAQPELRETLRILLTPPSTP